MFYPSSAGTTVSFTTPMVPGSRAYYPAAPMSAVLPGQHYYPTMHAAPMMGYPATAAPMMAHPGYGYQTHGYQTHGYYGHQPTVIMSAPSKHRRHRSRSRSRGFLGYL